MEINEILKEGQKATEQYMLVVDGIYSIMLAAVTLWGGWPAWLAVMLGICFCVSFMMYMLDCRTYQFRAYFMAGMLQVHLVLWSISVASLYLTLPLLVILAVMLGLYRIPEIIYIVAGSATLLNIYHIVVVKSAQFIYQKETIHMGLEIVSVYFAAFIMYVRNEKQIEGFKKQQVMIESLKEAERSKDDFLANVSHEIRTPINTICGMGEILLHEELKDSMRKDILSIQLAGHRLQAAVSDILDFSELQSGKIALAEEEYHITSTLNDIIHMSMARMDGRQVELIIDCMADMPGSLYGDEQKIRRVTMNLVDNALKFTREGYVSISVSSRQTPYGMNLIVRVKDTGIGLKEESVEKLFTSFNQVDTKRSRQEGGIGLGLAISQAMVDMMGGFMSVQSEYGKGSQFQFVVPQKVVSHKPAVAVRDPGRLNVAVYIDMEQIASTDVRDEYGRAISHMMEQLHVKSHFCRNLEELKQRAKREAFSHIFISIAEYGEGREYFNKIAKDVKVILVLDRQDEAKVKDPNILRLYKPFYVLPIAMILNEDIMIQNVGGNDWRCERMVAPGTSVLIVDDNIINVRVLEGLLAPYEIKCAMAASGAEALERIETMEFDLVFLDHMMPEMDGVETLHRIRQKQGNYFKKIPAVALTANAIGGMREVFLEEGFQDFMAKPVELSVLERVLKRNLPQEKLIYVKNEDNARMQGITPGDGPVALAADTGLLEGQFDRKLGMKYCGGLENYIEVLKLTYREGPDGKEKLQACFDNKDWKNYTVYAHALKSSMMNIGERKLSVMAKELEEASKRGDIGFILSHHQDAMLEYGHVLEIMGKSRLACQDMQQGMPEGTVSLKTEDLDRLALEFEDAAFAFDEEGMAGIAKRLAGCSYHGHPLQGQAETVMRKIRMSDFMSASELVSRLKHMY